MRGDAIVSVVMKFGGTSVADPDAINRLIGTVRQQQAKTKSAPLVVVSALSGVTDTLVAMAQLAEDGAPDQAAAEVQALLERHIAVANAVTSTSRAAVIAEVRREIEELHGLVHALAVLREVSPRSLDADPRGRRGVEQPDRRGGLRRSRNCVRVGRRAHAC